MDSPDRPRSLYSHRRGPSDVSAETRSTASDRSPVAAPDSERRRFLASLDSTVIPSVEPSAPRNVGEDQITVYRERVRALERELRYKDEQLTVATRKLQTELDASQTRTKQLTLLREMQKNAEEEIAAKQNECEFLTSRLHAMEEDLKDRDDKIDDMHRKIAELEESVAESRATARKIEQEAQQRFAALDMAASADIAALEQRLAEAHSSLEEQRASDEATLSELPASQRTSKVIDKLKSKLDKERVLVASTQETVNTLRAEVARLKQEASEQQTIHRETTERLEKDVQGMLELYQGLEQEHQHMMQQLKWANEQTETHAKELSDARADADEQRRIAAEQTSQANTLQRQLRGRDKQNTFLSEQLRSAETASRTQGAELKEAQEGLLLARKEALIQGERANQLALRVQVLEAEMQPLRETAQRADELLSSLEEEARSKAKTAETLSQRVKALDDKLLARDEQLKAVRKELQQAFDDMKFLSAKKQAKKVIEQMERELEKLRQENDAHREQTVFLSNERDKESRMHADVLSQREATIERLETDVRNVVELHTAAVDESRVLQDKLRALEEERTYWASTGERQQSSQPATEIRRELTELQMHFFNVLLGIALRQCPDALPVDEKMLFQRVLESTLPYKDWGTYIKRYVEPL